MRVNSLVEKVNTQQAQIENLDESVSKIEKHNNEVEELSPEVVNFMNHLYKLTQ